MSFDDNRLKFNHFLKVADANNELQTFALIDELFAEDYVLHTGGSTLSDPKDVKGCEGLREHVRVGHRTFGNVEHIVEDEFGDDYRLATRVRFRASLIGEFMGFAPTGQLIECTIIYITHFRNGKIQECWLDWDSLLTVSAQLVAIQKAKQG
jgi:predicted ester cyclase